MKSFECDGKTYRSLSECCTELNISYAKVIRLTRHYVRAQHDPSLAIKWLLGQEHKAWNEPKTLQYFVDLDKSKNRQWRFKAKLINKFKTLF